MNDGDDLTLVASGGITGDAVAAAQLLAKNGISCRVLSFHTLQPFDSQAIRDACNETGGILTVEENVLAGGLGGAVAEVCLDGGYRPRRFHRAGVSGFAKIVGNQDHLRKINEIDAKLIAVTARELLSKGSSIRIGIALRLKRIFDVISSAVLLLIGAPFILIAMMGVWLYDRHSPFYIAPRVGLNGAMFNMVKLRSMIVSADKSGVSSTSANDRRITPVGHVIRRLKIDELIQLWNVLIGDMSLVGPRPQVRKWGVDLYTAEELRLLSVRPGITDLASIVFSDEGNILRGAARVDLEYNQLIRPWKSCLGLLYIDHRNLLLDIRIVWLTVIAVISRPHALRGVVAILRSIGAPDEVIQVAGRKHSLVPTPPPGSAQIVTDDPYAKAPPLPTVQNLRTNQHLHRSATQ